MKLFNKLYGASLLSLLLSVAACTTETEDPLAKPSPEPSDKAERREVLLTLKNKLSVVPTKADPIATAGENKISSLDIYVFGSETEGGIYTYQERFCYRENTGDMPSGDDVTALDLTAKDADAKETTALLSLQKGLFVKLYCIANQPELFAADGKPVTKFQALLQSNPGQTDNTVTAGVPTEADFLTYHSPLIDPASTTDILTTPLPMTGAYTTPLDLTDFSVSARLQLGFRLTRTVARFDVVNNAATSKFTIQSVSMAKGRKGVSFFPLKVTGTLPTAADGDLITYPARPFDGDKANTGIATGAFYCYPSPVEDGGYLILSGTYAANQTENTPVTYKVPFKPADGGNYIEVSQNHRYTVNITAADEYHLDFMLDVADWTDEGSIDDYKPGGEEGETDMEVKVDMTAGATYDPDTRTVTLPVNNDAKFQVVSTSSSDFTTSLYYEGGDTQHQWLLMDPAPDFGPRMKSGDGATGTTFTIKKNPDYKENNYPVAFIRFTDNVSTKETILIVQPPLTITKQPTVLDPEAESTGTFEFVASLGSAYTIAESSDWLELTSNNSGDATGKAQVVGYKAVKPNPHDVERTAEITVTAGDITEKVEVRQNGSILDLGATTVALEPALNSTGSFTFKNSPGLDIEVSTDGNWLELSGTTTGTTDGENQTVNIKAKTTNPNAAARTATITVKTGEISKTVTISQTGSAFGVTNAKPTIAAAKSSKATVSVTATDGLSWTISPTSGNGISVSPTSGTGNQTLTFTAANNGSAQRSGTFTVTVQGASSTRSFTVTVSSIQVAKTGFADTWDNVKSRCNAFNEEGYNNWRLPSRDELSNIWSNKSQLQAISGFEAFYTGFNWTSEEDEKNASNAWIVRFDDGEVLSRAKSNSHYVARCVRDVK